MSKIFAEPIHGEAYINLVQDLVAAGHTVVGPTQKVFDYGFPQVCEWREVNDKIEHIPASHLTKAGINIVWCAAYEQCNSAISLGKTLSKPVILAASVNDQPYKDAHSPYLVATDLMTFRNASIRHKVFYAPAPDTIFGPPSPLDSPRENVAISLIIKHRELWPVQYSLWTQIAARYAGRIRFDHHENLGRHEVAGKLKKVSALLHLKASEGWGWSLVQAAISGCPVIVNGDLPIGRSCGLFLKHGINAWFLSTNDPVSDFGRALDAIPSLSKDQGRYAAGILHRPHYLAGLSEFITWVAKDVGRMTPPSIKMLVPQ